MAIKADSDKTVTGADDKETVATDAQDTVTTAADANETDAGEAKDAGEIKEGAGTARDAGEVGETGEVEAAGEQEAVATDAGAATTVDAKKRWYVVHVYSQREKKIKQAIEDKIELEGVQAQFGEILVPTEDVIEMKNGQKRKSERKFFPGYVLIEMEMNEKTWHLIRNITHVLGFMGGGDKPAPLSAKEFETIFNRVQDTVDKPTPKTLYEVGEIVRVTDGPFADFSGEVKEVHYEKSRISVSLLIFGRLTPVELSFGQVEKEQT